MSIGRRAAVWVIPLLLMGPIGMEAHAQSDAVAPGTVPPSAVQSDTQEAYTQQQLDQMLAPIALYPDKLLMNILMAATYPDQLALAQSWLQNPGNAALKGDALLDALKPLTWDPSVKAIVQFPRIVDLLTKNPSWTQSIGAAFDNQQDELMAQVQYLRQQAKKTGNLKSNDKIVVQDEGPNVVIQPADPQVVYVPYYNPAVVYGPWPWAAYPPVYFPGAYFGVGPLALGVGWGWGPAYPVIAPLWGWYGVGWGIGGGVFFHAGYGPRFGWYGRGWGGGGWRGGGWRHGGRGFYGHSGYHGRGFVGGGRAGFRPGGRPGGGRAGFRPGGRPGAGRAGVRPGGGGRGAFRAGGRPGGRAAGARSFGRAGGARPAFRGGGRAAGGFHPAARGGGGGRGGGGRGGGRHH